MNLVRDFKSYSNPRIYAVFLLAFSSGLPLLLTGSTLQACFTVSGVGIYTIGALTLVCQPYVYKFLWAPLFDRFVPLKLGRRRSWILLMQFALAVSLAVMAFFTPTKAPWALASIALIVSFFSASQDIGIDAYRTDILPIQERGLGAALNTIGYRIAMLIAGAIALIMAAKIGWRITYLFMAGLMFLEMFVTVWAPRPEHYAAPKSLAKAVIEPWREFMTRRNAIVFLVFIVIYKLSDAFALSLNTYFLIHGVGFSLIEIGTVAKVSALPAALLGSFIGGVLLPRMGLYRSLMYFGFLQMASNLVFIWLAVVGKNILVMGTAIFVENLCGSLGTVAFVVLLMSLCNKRYTATQYALLSALAAVGRVYVGPEAAWMVKQIGWIEFYIWTFFMGIPALAILWWLNRRTDFTAEVIAEASNS